MNRIKIIGLKNLPFESIINPDKDYAVTLIASLDGVFEKSGHGEEEVPKTYHLRADRVEQIIEVGGHEVKFEQGTTKSQIMRYALRDWAKRRNETDPETFYAAQMDKLIKYINGKDL